MAKHAAKKAADRPTVKVTLDKRPIDRKQAKVVESMGLRRIRHSVELLDTAATRGMILKVRHLVTTEESKK